MQSDQNYNQYNNQQGFNNQQGYNNQQGFNNNQQGQGQTYNQYQQDQSYDQFGNNNQNYDNENQAINKDDLAMDEGDLSSGLLGQSRLGFIRKVYLLLFAMLSLVVIFTGISLSSQSLRNFQNDNMWLYITVCFLAVFVQITLFCYPSVARTVPQNYLLTFVFASCFAYMVGSICGFFSETDQQNVVFIAAALTGGIVLALTLYAITTKTDFTMMGGLLFMMCMTMIMFGLFMWIFGTSYVANMIYCSLGVLLFGLYLVFDTQLIVGGKNRKFQLDYDDYILGACMLFIDIIQIFLYLLQLLGRR